MARPRTYTPAEAQRRDKAHKAASAKRRAPVFNERRRERRFRSRQLDPRKEGHRRPPIGDAVVSAPHLKRPNLLWMGPDGVLRSEKWESAEELIERLRRSQLPEKKQQKSRQKHTSARPESRGKKEDT